MNTVTFYLDFEGKIYAACPEQVALFNLLAKFGCKNVPTKTMSILTTTSMPPGQYVISYNMNNGSGWQNVSQTVTVTGVTITPAVVEVPKVEKAPRKGPNPEERKQWRTIQKKHSRNTGLKVLMGGRR